MRLLSPFFRQVKRFAQGHETQSCVVWFFWRRLPRQMPWSPQPKSPALPKSHLPPPAARPQQPKAMGCSPRTPNTHHRGFPLPTLKVPTILSPAFFASGLSTLFPHPASTFLSYLASKSPAQTSDLTCQAPPWLIKPLADFRSPHCPSPTPRG